MRPDRKRAFFHKSFEHLTEHGGLLDGKIEEGLSYTIPRTFTSLAQMLNALGVLLESDDVGDGFFLAIIAAHNELEFDAHGRAPLGLSGG
jgi:hypothetical protein